MGSIVDELLDSLDSPDWDEREQAILSIRDYPSLRDEELAPLLPSLLRSARDPSWQVRFALAELLQSLQPSSFDRLLAILQDDRHQKVRTAADRAESKWRQLKRRSEDVPLQELASLRRQDPDLALVCERVAQSMLQEATKTIAHDFLHHAHTINDLPAKLRRAASRGATLEPHFKRLEQVVAAVTGLSRDLQAYGRREALEFASEGVLEIMEVAVDRVRSSSEGAEITFVPEAPSDLRADLPRAAFVSALENLIRNAAEELARAQSPRRLIYVTADQEGVELRVSVRDTGPGFNEDLIDACFLPGFSPEKKKRSGSLSTGMGLSIAHSIVLRCAGRIEVENNTDEGATVSVIVPTKQAS